MIGYNYCLENSLYAKICVYGELLGKMQEENLFIDKKKIFEDKRKALQTKNNHAQSMRINSDIQRSYSELGDLF